MDCQVPQPEFLLQLVWVRTGNYHYPRAAGAVGPETTPREPLPFRNCRVPWPITYLGNKVGHNFLYWLLETQRMVSFLLNRFID